MNIFFWRKIYKYTWYRDLVEQHSIIDFCIISADLFSYVIDVHDKKGAELSIDHYIVVCIFSGLNHMSTRKPFRA